MRRSAKILFVLAILSFLVIFALKMQNYQEAKEFYSTKIEKAEQRLTELELKEAHGQELDLYSYIT